MDALDWLDAQGTKEAHAVRDELAALRKDAERYRALRDHNNQIHEDDPCVSDSSFQTYFGADLDAAADKLVLRHRSRNPPTAADLLPNAQGNAPDTARTE